MRFNMAGEWEEYFYPDTNVLRNKFDVRDPTKLENLERDTSRYFGSLLRENPIPGAYDINHLSAIHKVLFGKVYDWAGEPRRVNMTKGHTLFALTDEIPDMARDAAETIRKAHYLRGLNKDQFADKITEVYGKLNMMHPFREGNGRATREFLYQLGKEAGYTLDFDKVDRTAWNHAAADSAQGHFYNIRNIFHLMSTPTRAVDFDRACTANNPALYKDAIIKHPELAGAVKALHNAATNGQDVQRMRLDISLALHAGRIVGDITPNESLNIMRAVAMHQSISTEAMETGRHRGVIVAVSQYHALLKTGEKTARILELSQLDRRVQENDRILVDQEQQGKGVVSFMTRHGDMPAAVAEIEQRHKAIQGKLPTHRSDELTWSHIHAMRAIERHATELTRDSRFMRHDQSEILKAAYWRGIMENYQKTANNEVDLTVIDAKLADRLILTKLPEIDLSAVHVTITRPSSELSRQCAFGYER
jgi:cell filamentation protein